MGQTANLRDRRTSVELVFEYLYDEIVSLRMLPGDKISEADIATRFGVSRQPVRDAFSRLEHMDLLLIRPQKATEIKRFSTRAIAKSRFVRAAVEAEVLRRAAGQCDAAVRARLDACLARQKDAVAANDQAEFTALDYEFHKSLCDIAGVDFAYEVVATEKASVDRLCRLSLSRENRLAQLLEDHAEIARKVAAGDAEGACAAGMVHLSRLDETIAAISELNPGYFDP